MGTPPDQSGGIRRRTQQGRRQAAFQAISRGYNGDAMAAMAVELAAAELEVPRTFNGRLIAWLQLKTGSSSSNLPGLMKLFANQQGAPNFSSLGEFDPGGS